MDIKISITENEKDKDFTEMLSYWKDNYLVEHINILNYNLEIVAKVYFLVNKTGILAGGNKQYMYCPAIVRKNNSEPNPHNNNFYKVYMPFILNNFLYDSYMIRNKLLEYLEEKDGIKAPGLKKIKPKVNLADRYIPKNENKSDIKIVLYVEIERPIENTLITELKKNAGDLFPEEFKKYLVEHTKISIPKKIKPDNLLTMIGGRYPFALNKYVINKCAEHKIKLYKPPDSSEFGCIKLDKIFNKPLFFNNMQLLNEDIYIKKKINPFKSLKQIGLLNSNNTLTQMLIGWDIL